MTYARGEIVESDEVSTYHCITRCVRRAFLCGHDLTTKQSFEHRREWIRSRLSFLVEVFAIEVIAYAVMSNHLHSLLRIRPDKTTEWSDKEVAKRWRTLFPLRSVRKKGATEPSKEEIEAITGDPKLIKLYRERLSNISWFNRCLNENIARRANKEDDCKGRFWEGRFYCQRVADLAAVLTCAVYIDLNPIRAGVTKLIEESDHTSGQDRFYNLQRRRVKPGKRWSKVSLLAMSEVSEELLTVKEYLSLLEETGRQIVLGKKSIPPSVEPILKRLKVEPNQWVETTKNFKQKFSRVVGSEKELRRVATRAGKAWFHGVESARKSFPNAKGAT